MRWHRLLLAWGIALGCLAALSILMTGILGRETAVWCAGNVLAAIDKLLGGWIVVPPAFSWVIAGALAGSVGYFAVCQTHRVGMLRYRQLLLAAAVALLIVPPLFWGFLETAVGPRIRWWQPEARLQPGQVRTFADIEFAWIPAGKFRMGSPLGERGRKSDETLHTVTLKHGLWMGRHEISQAQWRSLMKQDHPWHFNDPQGQRPVDNADFEACEKFLAELNATGAGVFRLPTEAEWEYACRAGKQSAYAFGENPRFLEQYAWFAENAAGETRPVGSRKPNAWGLYDLHGNVEEYCLDTYGNYPAWRVSDPLAHYPATPRVVRGGYWSAPAEDCRAAARSTEAALFTDVGARGFRVVRLFDPSDLR